MVVGVVFLLAGIFKLLDPVGSALVVEEYYKFLHLPFLIPTAKVVAVALAFVEAMLGAALISGIRRSLAAFLTLFMVGFFTVITLILAIFNPAMDCGCFGEVVHLTNTQTFLKNLVLLALCLFAFFPMSDIGTNKKRKDVSFCIAAASIVAFTIYCLLNIPMMDFTSFTPGSELLASKDLDLGDEDEYTSTFIYEKNGQQGVFTLDKLPDSTWTFVRAETVKINRLEVEDRSPELSFSDSLGNYRNELACNGNVLAFSVYDASSLKGESWSRISEAIAGAKAAGFVPILLASATREAIDSSSTIIPESREQILGSLFFADRKTLLAMNRSNGGATWFSDGELIRKYSSSNIPSDDELLEMTGADPTEAMLHTSTKGRLRFEGFVLYVLAILLLL